MGLASQFSLLQSDPLFFDVVLFDIWYPYYETCFDVSQDRSLFLRPFQFQCEFLYIVLSKFSRITRVPSNILRKCLMFQGDANFETVTELSVCLSNHSELETLNFRDFLKFTNLKALRLENICIDLACGGVSNKIEKLSLISSYILSVDEENSLKLPLLYNLRTFDFRPLTRQSTSRKVLEHFITLPHIEELIVYFHTLKTATSLDIISNLRNLRKLTLYSYNNYHFAPDEQQIFQNLIEKVPQDSDKYISDLEIYGIPEKYFFQSRSLKTVHAMNWVVDKIFHNKADGSVEWCSSLRLIMQTFYEYVVTSKNLNTVIVDKHIVHSNRLTMDSNFENDLQTKRQRLGHKRIDIISKSTGNGRSTPSYDDHFCGFMTVIIHKYSL